MKFKSTMVVFSAAMLVSACGGGGEEAREKKMEAQAAKYGIDADVELDDKGEVESVEVKTFSGATVGKNVSLPDDFPSDVPLVDAWSVNAVSPAPGGGYMVNALAEGAKMDDVAAAVRDALAGKGWTEGAGGVAMAQMTQLRFDKDGRIASYTLIDGNDGNISVQLVTMKMPG